ncbi:MAG TPA: carbohydrate ABC transporter permease [Ruminococcaceae bacterium]|nr:carbohydrate ABC transporter permease [Oscillospiraceae bacterium]
MKLFKNKPFQKKSTPQYRRYTRSTAGNVVYFGILFLAGAFTVLPLIYCIVTSFKPLDELLIFPPQFFVKRPTFSNYLALPSLLSKIQVPISRYFFNSIFVAVAGTLLHIFAASLAAFTFSKSKVKGKEALFWIVQIMLLYNSITLAIPRYYIYTKLHLIDTYWVYILPAIPSATGCFLMKQYMDASVPDALMEAARIDGAGVIKMYISVIMPILKPAWMTMLLLSFQEMWTIIPQGTIFSEQLKTLPQVMSSISAGGIARSGSAMAVTVILMIPPILVFLISQSNVMETMSTSGIKE